MKLHFWQKVWGRAPRNRQRFAWLAVTTVLFVASCSSDPDTPLGTEFRDDGLIGAHPGRVFEDTSTVASGDTTAVLAAVLGGKELLLGRKDGFETAMIIRFDFFGLVGDTRTVREASLSIPVKDGTASSEPDSIIARFYELGTPFTELFPPLALDLADSIPDETGEDDRVMRQASQVFELPPGLVQSWIEAGTHNGIAVVVADETQSAQFTYGARELCAPPATCSTRPRLSIVFEGGTSELLVVSQDGTFVTDLQSPSQLVLGDGVVRRVHLPLDLSSVAASPENVVHNATLRLYLVGPSVVGDTLKLSGDLRVDLYVPDSSDPSNADFKTGLEVFSTTLPGELTEETPFLVPVGTAVLQAVASPEKNNGLVLRYKFEQLSPRRVKICGSDGPERLRPAFFYTFSEPPEFRP